MGFLPKVSSLSWYDNFVHGFVKLLKPKPLDESRAIFSKVLNWSVFSNIVKSANKQGQKNSKDVINKKLNKTRILVEPYHQYYNKQR